jgi:hypothetical protein
MSEPTPSLAESSKKMFGLMCDENAKLRARVAELDQENTTLRACIKDDCETEEEVKKLALKFLPPLLVEGDSHGVPNEAGIVENLIAHFTQRLATLEAERDKLREADARVAELEKSLWSWQAEATKHLSAFEFQKIRMARLEAERERLRSATWPCVFEFARRMEAKLDLNRHKGDREGWLKDSPEALFCRIKDELHELDIAMQQGYVRLNEPANSEMWANKIANECADVANFAMMVADWYLHGYVKDHDKALSTPHDNTTLRELLEPTITLIKWLHACGGLGHQKDEALREEIHRLEQLTEGRK